jgi:hypothetical protein
MKKNKQEEAADVFMTTCAWCRQNIDEADAVFCIGAKTKQDLQDEEGTVILVDFPKTSQKVPAMVVTGDSQAKLNGYDVAFMVCSSNCGRFLKKALTEETEVIDHI